MSIKRQGSKHYNRGSRWLDGFTIVELLVVIVVIAILATITIVSYTGIQEKARDSIRLQHSRQIADAIRLYNIDHGNAIGQNSGCGSQGNGSGWFNRGGPHDPLSLEGEVYYTRSTLDCLLDAGLLSPSVVDPLKRSAFSSAEAGKPYAYAYMKYNCDVAAQSSTYIFLRLESRSASEAMDAQGIVCENSAYTTYLRQYYALYGMNYWVKV